MKTLMVKNERLIKLLYHEDKRVRNASITALENFFPKSHGVIEHILTTIKLYRKNRLPLMSSIKYFIPTDKDIRDIIQLYNELDPSQDDHSLNFSYHLRYSFFEFPFEILEKNHSIISFNKDLLNAYEIAKNREMFKKEKPDYLWNELEELCKKYKDNKIEGEDYQYCNLLVEGLSRHREKVKHKIILSLSHEKTDNYHLELYLVELAGRLKIEETVPFLFRIFKETDPMSIVHDQLINVLGMIGTVQVVNGIENLYHSKKDLRNGLASVLKYIPHDYSEDCGIRLFKSEKEVSTKTFLASSLCDIFSIKAADIILHMIKNKQYEPIITNLIDQLIPVYVYHKETVNHLAELELEAQNYSKQAFEASPLHELVKPFKQLFEINGKEEIHKIPNNQIISTEENNILTFNNASASQKKKKNIKKKQRKIRKKKKKKKKK